MLPWLSENLATIIIGALVFALLTFVTVRLIKNKRAGKSTCSCGCGGCAMQGVCHKKKEEE